MKKNTFVFPIIISIILGLFVKISLLSTILAEASTFFAICTSVPIFLLTALFVLPKWLPLMYPYNLRKIGFINKDGETPRPVKFRKHDKRLEIVFENRGIPLEDWLNRQSDIEAALNIQIIDMVYKHDRRHIMLDAVIADGSIPAFLEWKPEYLPPESFALALGQGVAGPIVLNLNDTPHLIIAGMSGGGKSQLMRLRLLRKALRCSLRILRAG